MKPSTGTFITMDPYQGSIFDPASLHKYLYAEANPVMNSDPTGYFTLADMNVSMEIQGILAKLAQPKIKFALNILDFLTTAVDTSVQINRMLQEGRSAEEIFSALSRGAISGLFLNKMCMIKGIGPILSKIVITFGFINQYKSMEQAFQEGDTALGTLRTLQMMIMGASLYESCFTGETLVSTEDGQKRIDEVRVGDYVWAYNVELEELELKKVTKIYEKETRELLHLQTSTGEIDTTSNHPFYVTGKGWVAAGDIETGDEIYTLAGSTATVLGLEYESLDEGIIVYNLEVEDFNSYFVGPLGVLVHNYKGTEAVDDVVEGTGKSANITNDVLKAPRAGSALKLDANHAFNDIVDNYAGLATKTPINNGTLYQLEGSLNGAKGRFEWIIDSTGQYAGQVSHRYFVSGGTLNGVPIKP